ncbi:unnamed protein product [Caenorhabditis angaria]|uniref:Uncharacterized protein n=1 Tax=Caenorhabditis angaria TaxID=860376 RepID=A0A9P1ICU1_9PELO|nr:unnamed protein product [Caenorhabditis angaria]
MLNYCLCDNPSELDILFSKIVKKEQSEKTARIVDLMNRAVPSGMEALNPAIAEYETFRSDKSSNFLNDGQGHVVFRQFRRIRISDLLSAISKPKSGNII